MRVAKSTWLPMHYAGTRIAAVMTNTSNPSKDAPVAFINRVLLLCFPSIPQPWSPKILLGYDISSTEEWQRLLGVKWSSCIFTFVGSGRLQYVTK